MNKTILIIISIFALLKVASYGQSAPRSEPTQSPACQKPVRHYYIKSAEANVWKTTMPAGSILPYHTHDVARVVIPEENGVLITHYKDSKLVDKKIILQANIPQLLPLCQGVEPHQEINKSGHDLHMFVIGIAPGKK